jgi:hypothetical protein
MVPPFSAASASEGACERGSGGRSGQAEPLAPQRSSSGNPIQRFGLA